ncbi:lipid A deacylase LpxR family protein [Pedobacter nyackensis]|uniref:lipid A deacylase LpxR family protein n=1 Tax=Pedobacter nyackensis TaxID=475255 RepID=UPI00292D5FF3|nr:lipid A deacylase LpxR family protein [Pedobacter nyackensis]
MKRLLASPGLLFIILLHVVSYSYAQHDTRNRLLQAYWDDDYINFYGNGTDKAYTNGTRFTLFYTKNKPSHFLFERVFPKAGDSSKNVFGFGLSQLIFTPRDIANPNFQPNDYPWSGALYATYSHYSYNEKKKYDLQTELDLGVIGPASLAEQTQKMIHKFVNYQEPNGWDNQFRNSLMLNLNFTAEKQLLTKGNFLEVIGGGQVMIGTGTNAAAVYSLIRIGKMSPYFQGLIRHYSRSDALNKTQLYFVFKPRVQWVLSNAILQGRTTANKEYYRPINNLLASYSFGVVLVINRFSVSSIQTTSTPWLQGLYSHTWGNFTFTYLF